MNKKDVLKALVGSVGLGFFVGLAICFVSLRAALVHIGAHKYLSYGLHRLATQELAGPLLCWLRYAFLIGLALFVLWLVWRTLVLKAVRVTFTIEIVDKKRLKLYAAVLVGGLFLFYAGWLVNSRWAEPGLSFLNVLLNVGVLLCGVGLGWLIARSGWEKVFRFIKLKYLARVGASFALLLLVLGALIVTWGKAAKRASGPNVVLVVVDCLRPDHLGCYGYERNTSPTIDALARQGVLFKNASSTASWTKPAAASLFSSLLPLRHGAINADDVLADEVLTLAEIFKNEGMRTLFFNGGNPYLWPHYGVVQGFDETVNKKRADSLCREFLARLKAGEKERFFAYLHLMDLHLPYYQNRYNGMFAKDSENRLLKPGHMEQKLLRTLTAEGSLSEGDKEYLTALYDGQVRLVDDVVARLVAGLKEQGVLEEIILVITADHGEELWDHGNFEHGHSLYREVLRVPLIIAAPGLASGQSERPVSLVDLAPTILDLARVGSKKWAAIFAGEDMFRGGERSILASATLYGDEKYCVIKDGWKLIFNSGKRDEKKPLIGHRSQAMFELFDLSSDPLERHNLAVENPGKLALLKKELDRYLSTAALGADKKKYKRMPREKVDELKRSLKSLGYL